MSEIAVRVLATSEGNEFMLDIASTLAEGMREAGFTCELAIDQLPVSDHGSLLQIIVAPHEYCPLFLERLVSRDSVKMLLAAACVLNVEQPGSSWFEIALNYSRLSRGAFDISSEGAEELRLRGLDAVHAPLGTVGGKIQHLPIASRTIDIAFLGHASSRREQFFADHAEFFSRRNCRLLFVDVARPRGYETPGYLTGQPRSSLLANSKIVLNIHGAGNRYFESHRALLALSHGCVLVTESSNGISPLIEGVHLVTAPIGRLAAECRTLLADPARLRTLSAAGYQFAVDHLRMSDTCRRMVEYAQRSAPLEVRPDRSDEELRKEVLRRLDERKRIGAHWTVEDNAAYLSSPAPSVSVVITAWNYSHYVTDCLLSVCGSRPVDGGVEVVVVDDASTDGTAEVAWRLLEEMPIPGRLVRKRSNTGVADARNVGTAVARGEFIFTLDADNWLYPDCLRVLSEALAANGLAAVYPILRRFESDSGESRGLLSLLPWSKRELVRGPYIDALAMFRRSTLESVGGYSTELVEHGWFGWEDYDLWLKLASAGHICLQVPQILAAYRVHSRSMITRTNRSAPALSLYLRKKFEHLGRAYPDLDRMFGFPVSMSGHPAEQHDRGGDELTQLRRHCQNLENERQALLHSWSWRLTAPVRAVFGWWRGLRSREHR